MKTFTRKAVMMKAIMTGVWILGVLVGCQSINDNAASVPEGYRYIQGQPWQGVRVGDQPPRQSSYLCYQYQCYRLNRPVSMPRDLQQRYQITGLIFDQLAEAPGVSRNGDELLLPTDLGKFLFDEARQRHLREMRSDKSPWMMP